MTYIVTTPFTIALDSVGHESIKIQAGELDVETLGISQKKIEWMLKNDLIDEVGEIEEPELDDLEVVIKTAESFSDRKALDAWAEKEHGIKLKCSMKLENMKLAFIAAITEEA